MIMKTKKTTERPSFKTRNLKAGCELAIALPGVSKKDIEVKLEKRILTISGDRKHESIHFKINIKLHEDLNEDNIKVTHCDGILTLILNKRRELAPRKIDILAN